MAQQRFALFLVATGLCQLRAGATTTIDLPSNEFLSSLGSHHHVHGDAQKLIVSAAAIPPSPKCWHTAIELVQKTQQDLYAVDAAKLCALLPESHQKRLALEIAQCHLHDLGKPLYTIDSIQHDCSSTATIDLEVVQYCLKYLTDAGVHSYTIYLTYVQALCTRLTQELILRSQHETQHAITTQYADMHQASIDQWRTLDEISRQHAAQMTALSGIPEQIREQLTVELKEQLHDTLQQTLDEQLVSKLNDLVQSQATELASFYGNLMDELTLRDVEHQTRYAEWSHFQASLWNQQAREMQRQRAALDEHRAHVAVLSETVTATTATMQPLVGLQSLLQLATKGYSWITFLLHFLGTFNIVWVLTWPERCHRFRSYMLALVLAEAVLELTLSGPAVRYNLLSRTETMECIMELRKWSFLIEAVTYVSGMLMSFFYSTGAPNNYHPAVIHTRDHPVVTSQQHQQDYAMEYPAMRERAPSSSLGQNPYHQPHEFLRSMPVHSRGGDSSPSSSVRYRHWEPVPTRRDAHGNYRPARDRTRDAIRHEFDHDNDDDFHYFIPVTPYEDQPHKLPHGRFSSPYRHVEPGMHGGHGYHPLEYGRHDNVHDDDDDDDDNTRIPHYHPPSPRIPAPIRDVSRNLQATEERRRTMWAPPLAASPLPPGSAVGAATTTAVAATAAGETAESATTTTTPSSSKVTMATTMTTPVLTSPSLAVRPASPCLVVPTEGSFSVPSTTKKRPAPPDEYPTMGDARMNAKRVAL